MLDEFFLNVAVIVTVRVAIDFVVAVVTVGVRGVDPGIVQRVGFQGDGPVRHLANVGDHHFVRGKLLVVLERFLFHVFGHVGGSGVTPPQPPKSPLKTAFGSKNAIRDTTG